MSVAERTQRITRGKAHELLNAFNGRKILVATYNKRTGRSSVYKPKENEICHYLANKSDLITYHKEGGIIQINLHKNTYDLFAGYGGRIVKIFTIIPE
jgi:hypothetical protein